MPNRRLSVAVAAFLLTAIAAVDAVCRDRAVRLAGGSSNLEGRVEVCFNNRWGTVCGNAWSQENARVTCRQLGFSTEGAISVVARNTPFGEGSGEIHLSGVQCSGTEANLTDCTVFPPPSDGSCSHANDTALICQVKGFSCQDGDVRLVDGPLSSAGRVEVCYNNQYGTICDDYWQNNDAVVVCKQLGYPAADGLAISSAVFGEGYGPIYLDDVNCSGTERNIKDCQHRGVGSHNCGHNQDASVLCKPVTPSCESGDVRLVNGNRPSEGRVEYCHNGVWGTVCHHSWQDSDAGVVCSQLGYERNGAQAVLFADFGEGEGLIFLDDVDCQGSEKFLNECSSNELGKHNCKHSSDAGVICPDPGFSCTNGEVRLAGSSTPGTGRVEVCYNNHFGTICGQNWGQEEASVVCRQLGFDQEGAIPVHGAYYGPGVGLIHLDQLHCSGSEGTLLNCPKGVGVGMSTCLHNRDASVICRNTSTSSPSACQSGAVRLVGGANDNEGRVEVCYSGQWGGVCANEWDNSDAAVACRQLGYHGNGALTSTNGFYGNGSVPVFRAGVSCSGNEINLLSCPGGGLGASACSTHHAGVLCPVSTLDSCENGEIRLIDGGSTNQGIVEFCYNGRWGTVNGENWSTREATVVCRQLGHDPTLTRSIAVAPGSFGEGEGPVFLTDVRCFGIESKLEACQHHSGIQFHSIGHSSAAAVVCAALPCEDGALRLSGGTRQDQGRVEVCRAGNWLPMCASKFTDTDAGHICSSLNHNQTGSLSTRGLFPSNSDHTQSLVYNSQLCGNSNIFDCLKGLPEMTSQCPPGDLAEVVCGGVSDMCSNGDVRLVSGDATDSQGRVEVCLGGEWGTVCDNSWDDRAATVICQQLRLPSEAAVATRGSSFGAGSGRIYLDDVQCVGNETRLTDCPSRGYLSLGCRHSEDAGVICRATAPSPTTIPNSSPTSTASSIDRLTTTLTQLGIPVLAALLGAIVIVISLTVCLIIVYKWRRHQTHYTTVLKSPPSSTRSTPKLDTEEP